MREMHKGTQRFKQIMEVLEKYHYLETWMLEDLLFKFPSGKTKSQEVMKRLYKQGLVNRYRGDSRDPYIYYIGQRSEKAEHWLMINQFHFHCLKQLKSWHRLVFWKHEFDYGYGIADGFYIIQNTVKGGGVKFFFEAVDNNNPFDRHEENYLKSFQGDWQKQWWADPRKKGVISYPKIICMSEKPIKIKTQEPKFILCNPTDVQRDVWSILIK